MKTSILHMDEHKHWRGGQNQILSFIKINLENPDITNFMACPKDSYSDSIFKNFVTTFPIEKSLLKNYFSISKEIKKNEISVVVAHTSKMHALGLMLKFFNRNLKLIVIRKVNKKIKKNPLKSIKYTTNLIDSYVTVSDKIKDTLVSSGQLDPNKIHVVKDFVLKRNVDLTWIKDFKSSHNIKENDVIFSTVGYLDKQKNQAFLIKALAKVKESHPNFKCLIAGEGPLKKELENLTSDLKLNEHVILLGFIDKVEEILSLSNSFVFPSINEGLGSSLLDAINYKCLLIGSRSGGIPEVIKDKENGYLFDLKSNEELVEILKKVIDNCDQLDHLKQAATTHLEKDFNSEKLNAALLKIYKS